MGWGKYSLPLNCNPIVPHILVENRWGERPHPPRAGAAVPWPAGHNSLSDGLKIVLFCLLIAKDTLVVSPGLEVGLNGPTFSNLKPAYVRDRENVY